MRCPEERGREVGGEVEDGAKSFNPKEVGENSRRTNRIRHKRRGFGRSDYRRRDDELKMCLEGLRTCTSVLWFGTQVSPLVSNETTTSSIKGVH